jgi:HTH-type transcriptional regulator, sugar sensing transcriptional regulator
MLEKRLEKLGLNEKEAKVYLAVLELGEGNIQDIAEKSGVKRTTVYNMIASLKEKGLVFEIQKKHKAVYYAEDPRKLKNDLEEKKADLEQMLPELLSVANMLGNKPKVKFYEGENGIKEVYKDTLNYPGEEIVAWFTDDFFDFDPDFIQNYYIPTRLKKKIWVRAIYPDTPRLKGFSLLDEKQLRKSKLVPQGEYKFKVEIVIYGKNRVFMISFHEKIALIIESQMIHETLKSIFELQWKSESEKEDNDRYFA